MSLTNSGRKVNKKEAHSALIVVREHTSPGSGETSLQVVKHLSKWQPFISFFVRLAPLKGLRGVKRIFLALVADCLALYSPCPGGDYVPGCDVFTSDGCVEQGEQGLDRGTASEGK